MQASRWREQYRRRHAQFHETADRGRQGREQQWNGGRVGGGGGGGMHRSG